MTEHHRFRPRLRAQLPTTGPALGVLAGDLLVLFAFIAVGQYAHQYLFWQAPVRTVLILTPFVVGWLLVAPVAGLFRHETLSSYKRTLLAVVPAWAVAGVIGAALRSTSVFPGGAPPIFVAVNVGVGLLFLAPWRLVAGWLYRRSTP